MLYYREHKKWAKENLEDAIRMVREYSLAGGMAIAHSNELRYNRLMKCAYLIQMALVRKERGW